MFGISILKKLGISRNSEHPDFDPTFGENKLNSELQLNTLECKADDRDVEIVEEVRIEAKEEKLELNGAVAGEKDDSHRKKRRKSELFNWEPPERTVNKVNIEEI